MYLTDSKHILFFKFSRACRYMGYDTDVIDTHILITLVQRAPHNMMSGIRVHPQKSKPGWRRTYTPRCGVATYFFSASFVKRKMFLSGQLWGIFSKRSRKIYYSDGGIDHENRGQVLGSIDQENRGQVLGSTDRWRWYWTEKSKRLKTTSGTSMIC